MVLEAGKFMIKALADLVSVEVQLSGSWMVTSHCEKVWWKERGVLSRAFFIRTLISMMRTNAHNLVTLQR